MMMMMMIYMYVCTDFLQLVGCVIEKLLSRRVHVYYDAQRCINESVATTQKFFTASSPPDILAHSGEICRRERIHIIMSKCCKFVGTRQSYCKNNQQLTFWATLYIV